MMESILSRLQGLLEQLEALAPQLSFGARLLHHRGIL